MRPVQYAFQKLSRTEQRKEGVAAYLWLYPLFPVAPPPPSVSPIEEGRAASKSPHKKFG